MAKAEDCVHVVALNASRKTIVAVRESLDTKTADAKVYDTLRQVDGFYEIVLADIKRNQSNGFKCPHCALEVLGPDYSFAVWTNKLAVEAIEWAVEIMRESA
jgi:hypothetical protein